MSIAVPIRIRALRLVGPLRDYLVSFDDTSDGVGQSLAIVAGQISTGKSTVLELIDWCLGAKSHPEHDEVMANVRSAQLSIDLWTSESDTQDVAGYRRFVIERSLGPSSTKAWLYEGDFSDGMSTAVRSFAADPADPESLSHYLLQMCGLAGLRLRGAPTQEESKTSVLSFRDLQPLWFLTNRRMDNGDLALEHQTFRSIKLVQVVNILFGVSDDETSALARQVEELAAEERELRRTVTTLASFLEDAGFSSLEELATQADASRIELVEARSQLRVADANLAATTAFASNLRDSFQTAMRRAREIEGALRDRETLARRLDPLRAQYADELRRLELVDESMQLFDSLVVVTCPACQSPLTEHPHVENDRCSLCGSRVSTSEAATEEGIDAPTDEDQERRQSEHDRTAGGPVDLSAERRSLSRRLNQLKGFSDEVRSEADELRTQLREAQRTIELTQADLDRATSDSVAPFLAERDILANRVAGLRSSLESIAKSRATMTQLRQKENELRQVQATLRNAKERQKTHSQSQLSQDVVLGQIAARIERILRDFSYPKVELVRVDRSLVPFVRGKRYDRVGSSGAMTLIALAWTLAIFELAIEQGSGHPGFLLIDSPQKNLLPGAVELSPDPDADLSSSIVRDRANIVRNIYAHIDDWLDKHPDAQVIIVDNAPPSGTGRVVVRYSGDPAIPPYGLIDNEDGGSSSQLANGFNS